MSLTETNPPRYDESSVVLESRTEKRDFSNEPQWSYHALRRYDQRTPSTSISPERAWKEGYSVQYVREYFQDGCYPSDVRAYPHANCHSIMIAMNNRSGHPKIVTVLLNELIEDSAVRGYIHNLGQMYRHGSLTDLTDCYGEDENRITNVQQRYEGEYQ